MGGARSVLVADDDLGLLAALERVLRRLGLEPRCVSTIDDAVAVLASREFDAILLDIEFPTHSGLALLRHLQAQRARTPVIVMSGAATIDDVVEVLRRGGVDFLRKPFPSEELSAAIDRAWARRGCACTNDRAPPTPRPLLAQAPSPDVNKLIRTRIEERCIAAGLSAREREVLDLVLLGRSLAEIGTVLTITPRTAKFHLSNILAKLGAESRADLVRIFL